MQASIKLTRIQRKYPGIQKEKKRKRRENDQIFSSLFVFLLVNICESALAAVLPVKVGGHEDTGPTVWGRTFPPESLDLSAVVYLVVLEHGQLHLLLLMLDLLGSGVVLLLTLLATSAQTQHQVEGRLLLDVVVREGAAIFQLLAGEDQTLLVGRDT